MRRHSIRQRLLIAFMGLATLSVVLTGLGLGWRGYRNNVGEAHARQQELAKRVAVQVQSMLQHIESELVNSVRLTDFVKLDRAAQERVVNRLLAGRDHFREILLFDTAGVEQLHLSNARMLPAGHAENGGSGSEFRISLQTHMPYFGPVHYDQDNNEPRMLLGVPVKDARGDRLGSVLLAEVRLKPVWHMIAELVLEPGEDVYLLDQDGRVIAHRNPSVVLRESRMAPVAGVRRQSGLNTAMTPSWPRRNLKSASERFRSWRNAMSPRRWRRRWRTSS